MHVALAAAAARGHGHGSASGTEPNPNAVADPAAVAGDMYSRCYATSAGSGRRSKAARQPRVAHKCAQIAPGAQRRRRVHGDERRLFCRSKRSNRSRQKSQRFPPEKLIYQSTLNPGQEDNLVNCLPIVTPMLSVSGRPGRHCACGIKLLAASNCVCATTNFKSKRDGTGLVPKGAGTETYVMK